MILLSRPAALSQTVQTHPYVFHALKHDVSPPLRDIKPTPPVPGPPRVNQRLFARPPKIAAYQRDPALQTSPGPQISVTPGLNFDGICNDSQTCGGSSQQSVSGLIAVPPDTNGAVGDTQFVQWVNYAFAVFDKSTRAMVYGPAAGNTLWKGFGGPCETNNSGDPIAQYDKAAKQWVLMQPVFTKPFAICFAVSTSSEYTGQFHRYAFAPTTYFPDYPKLGIWPDGYYMSIDQYTGLGFGGKFQGAMVCALDRSAMLNGDPMPAMVCFQAGLFPSLLPSDLDGSTAPPLGSPNYLLNLVDLANPNSQSLNFWKFHVDFSVSPPSGSLSGPTKIPVAPFSEACGGGICIPQKDTNRLLDSLGDRLMYRLAYRKLSDHEALVVNHSVSVQTNAGASVGVRWYEIRNPSSCGTPPQPLCSIFQQGTFAPDANFRWMGSVAMDKLGDIAVGYSVSNSGMHPAIRFAGRAPGDHLGVLGTETSIIEGAGSQTNASNWGDYSSMSIDPVDDCTFWYTTEYLTANGNYNWSTRIASFRFSSCP
jgi:hypothetical protein